MLSLSRLLERIAPPEGRVHMVLDTDTFNEIDDQFALVYALLSPEKIDLEAVYAAPFQNDRSVGPGDGMEKSYEEILRVINRLDHPSDNFVYRGSTTWLPGPDKPVRSPAAENLIERALARRDGPLYVVGIAAVPNIASAILLAPEIIEKIVVVWLGGNPHYYPRATEFNVFQDMHASRVLFNSGVPLVHIPCMNVTEQIRTTQAELERFVKGRGAIGDYLYDIFSAYYPDHYARSKEIWDIGPIAWLLNPAWVPSSVIHSPILTSEHTWSFDADRHLMREAYAVKRDLIFADLFRKLEARHRGGTASTQQSTAQNRKT